MEWISVKDRLPDVAVFVLTVVDGQVGAGMLLDDDYWASDIHPTHWMPLPEPPEPNE